MIKNEIKTFFKKELSEKKLWVKYIGLAKTSFAVFILLLWGAMCAWLLVDTDFFRDSLPSHTSVVLFICWSTFCYFIALWFLSVRDKNLAKELDTSVENEKAILKRYQQDRLHKWLIENGVGDFRKVELLTSALDKEIEKRVLFPSWFSTVLIILLTISLQDLLELGSRGSFEDIVTEFLDLLYFLVALLSFHILLNPLVQTFMYENKVNNKIIDHLQNILITKM